MLHAQGIPFNFKSLIVPIPIGKGIPIGIPKAIVKIKATTYLNKYDQSAPILNKFGSPNPIPKYAITALIPVEIKMTLFLDPTIIFSDRKLPAPAPIKRQKSKREKA